MSLTGRFSALFLGALTFVLIVFSTIMLVTVELLRRRGERLRGIKS